MESAGGGSIADVTAPSIVSATPEDGATEVAVNSVVTVSFSEALDCGSTSEAITLASNATTVTGSVTCSGASITFTPSAVIDGSTRYEATVSASVSDTSGNALATEFKWSFTTGVVPDITPPEVISTIPTADAAEVALDSAVTMTFSESMDCAAVTDAFALEGGDAQVEGTLSCNGTEVTFSPAANLEPGLTYTVSVGTAAKDGAGNALASALVWSFTTIADVTPPAITITSHEDGATITGSRIVTLQWAGSDDISLASMTLNVNGIDTTFTNVGENYAAELALADNTNEIVITAYDTTGNSSSATLTLNYPYIRLGDGQAAVRVIGHADFNTGSVYDGGAADAGNFSWHWANPVVHEGRLYLPDYESSRILGYSGIPTGDGADADFVWGQPDFTTVTPGTTSGGLADRLAGSDQIHFSGDAMVISDYDNNRVLLWYTIPAAESGYIAADVVVGKGSGSDGSDVSCDVSTLQAPEFAFIVGTKLIVADADHNRVLIWNTLPTSDGEAADLVLGQADFTSCNVDRGSVTPAADTLDYPTSIWSDGTQLMMVDADNNRVLIWDTFPTANGQAADRVLGQPDMMSDAASNAAEGMYWPYFVTSNGNQLFVADMENHRVLVWDSIPSSDGQGADHVLGQAGFDLSVTATSATGLNEPSGVFVDGSLLLVGDSGNARYLVFEGQ